MRVLQDNQLAFQVLLGQQVLAKISQDSKSMELDADQFFSPTVVFVKAKQRVTDRYHAEQNNDEVADLDFPGDR